VDLLTASIGIGLAVALLLSEFFGMAGAGLVIPGYLALHLTNPLQVAVTIAAGLLAFFAVRALSTVVIIFGRRRTVLMILIGYVIGIATRYLMEFVHFPEGMSADEFAVIGFIVPGLIAVWIDRRGIIESICSLMIASVIVRLILIILIGARLAP
jgi:gamma-polyglutamate biosynthesis protein CapC